MLNFKNPKWCPVLSMRDDEPSKPESRTSVIVHDPCQDGFTAAWVAWLKYGHKANFFGHTYAMGDLTDSDIDLIEGTDVLIADYSFSINTLRRIAKRALHVTVLDHHRSFAQHLMAEGLLPKGNPDDLVGESTEQNIYIVFDNHKSGAKLAFERLRINEMENAVFWPGVGRLVDFVSDRDLWTFALPGTKSFYERSRLAEENFQAWSTVALKLTTDPESFCSEGDLLIKYRDQEIARQMADVVLGWVGHHLVPIINSQYAVSETCNELAKKHSEAPFAAAYTDRVVRGMLKRVWSLRSTKESGFDVSALAKQFGGGGHKNAAGFTVAFVPKSSLNWLHKPGS
jgi:oligoribonuclease NrnB/cAMP/cGMP phosphodiesterase (DHH superfamily)